jgi:hypothetical protein
MIIEGKRSNVVIDIDSSCPMNIDAAQFESPTRYVLRAHTLETDVGDTVIYSIVGVVAVIGLMFLLFIDSLSSTNLPWSWS